MKKGARIAVLAAVALALPIVITLATYAIAASSLEPTSWLSISVDSHRLEATPSAHPSQDSDGQHQQPHHKHQQTHTAHPTSTPTQHTPAPVVSTSSPDQHHSDDDRGGDSHGSNSGGGGGGGKDD